jgi:hypothetical protein
VSTNAETSSSQRIHVSSNFLERTILKPIFNNAHFVTSNQYNKLKALKEMIQTWAIDSKEILSRNALGEHDRATIIDYEDTENNQFRILSRILRDLAR